ncbi:hypothetical protein [Brevundimonas sp.]|uniref:hypothetical protein n=1 Tax=Brevundimonas sp. TaxID=1871086 RepID=UPI002FC6E949
MTTAPANAAPDRVAVAAKVGLIWLSRILAFLFLAASLLVAVMRLTGATNYSVTVYVGYLASRPPTLHFWDVLMGLDYVLSLTAIVGIGVCLLRRRLLLALLFATLAWPLPIVLEGSNCPTASTCRILGWAAPAELDWSIQLRPVTRIGAPALS